MSDDLNASVSLDPSIIEQLACPVCLGALRLRADRLLCANCGRRYPVVDGIPALTAERAIEENRS
jgi:uncharacterized protein YbaR (Trm112 family)